MDLATECQLSRERDLPMRFANALVKSVHRSTIAAMFGGISQIASPTVPLWLVFDSLGLVRVNTSDPGHQIVTACDVAMHISDRSLSKSASHKR